MPDYIIPTEVSGAPKRLKDMGDGTWAEVVSTSGGGGGSSTVTPVMASGGNLSVQTAATGTNWTAFASQACKQLTISNQTGTTLEVRQGGAGVGLQIPTGAFYTFFGITNTDQLGVRRVDTSNTQVTATARWES